MRSETIALNYAEALFALAEKQDAAESYADLIDAVAAAVEQEPRIEAVLMSPRVPKAAKSKLLADALPGVPREFVLFLQAVVKRGRQGLLREISDSFLGLVDIKFNRARATVILSREPDEELRQRITQGLSTMLDKEIITRYLTDPAILGGAVVRVGDRVYDGSVRRRMKMLRRTLTAKQPR